MGSKAYLIQLNSAGELEVVRMQLFLLEFGQAST